MFARLLMRAVDETPAIDGVFHLIDWQRTTLLEALPVVRTNWSLRASLKAARLLLPGLRQQDVLFFHTQTASLLAPLLRHGAPLVISTDATPRNLDTVAASYGHLVGSPRKEAAKRLPVSHAYRSAAAVVPWSEWAASSVVDDYGVDPSVVTVVKPSLFLDDWVVGTRTRDGPVRILFVGGDFARKGGDDLLVALQSLGTPWTLDAVTESDVRPASGVRVHHGLTPGSPALRALYANADIFALPTHGDCLPWVVLEAMASGLPVVSTDVGAIPETIGGHGGVCVSPGDREALLSALRELAGDPAMRAELGAAARRRVEREHDARRNLTALLGIVERAAA